MTKPINKEILSNALLTLGKVLNNPQEKHVDGVINMLKSAMTEKKEVRLVRADTLADEASSAFVPTGVDWLDAWIRGGIRRGELVLIGACPHAGKTHTLTWFGIQYRTCWQHTTTCRTRGRSRSHARATPGSGDADVSSSTDSRQSGA